MAFLTVMASLCAVHAQSVDQLLASADAALARRPEQAFALYEDAMTLSRTQRNAAAYLRAAGAIGMLGVDKGIHADDAFRLLKDAVSAVAYNSRDTALASVYYDLARFYKTAYESDEAIRYFTQAAGIYEAALGPNSLQAATCFHGLADVYKFTVFNFQLAEEYYEKALEIREKMHFPESITLFNNIYGLAATNRSQRDFDKAVSYGTVAVALAKKLDIVRQEYANSLMGNIFRDMRNTTEAVTYYNEALGLNSTTGNEVARASHLQNLGEMMLNESLYSKALDYFDRADKTYSDMRTKDERLFHRLLIDRAGLFSESGDEARFEAAIQRVFRELKRSGKERSNEAADTYVLIADHYARQKKFYSAVDQCQLALAAAVPGFNTLDIDQNPSIAMIGSSFEAGEILSRKGQYLRDLYRHTGKTEYLRLALNSLYLSENLLSQERNALDTEEAKWTYSDAKYAVYENIVACLYETYVTSGDRDAADLIYFYFERSKARSLADALMAAERTRAIGANDSVMVLHARLGAEIFSVENRVKGLAGKGKTAEINSLRARLVSLDRQLQNCNIELERRYPGYFGARYARDVTPLRDVQELAGADDRVILEFFWGAESVYAIGIGADSLSFARIGRTDSIARIIDQVVAHLHNEQTSGSPAVFQTFVNSSNALYQLLLKPFTNDVRGKALHIIPDGAISLVPFEILVTDQPTGETVDYRSLPYLIRQHSIGYAYSTAMLRTANVTTTPKRSVLAVGYAGAAAPLQRGIAPRDIQGVERELDALAARFSDGKFLRAQEATEYNFKSLSPAYDIIHLAVHGSGDRSATHTSSLYFQPTADSLDDGVLHAYELYGLRLKAVMAVLSACESGVGKDYRGEGMISMASAFASAGCENTLMSLWKVNDQASTTLMEGFYRYLMDGEPIDDALRKAKLDYLQDADELTADPKTWAPLVAYGSLHQVFEAKHRTPVFVLVVAAIALVAGLLFLWRRNYRGGGSRSPFVLRE